MQMVVPVERGYHFRLQAGRLLAVAASGVAESVCKEWPTSRSGFS